MLKITPRNCLKLILVLTTMSLSAGMLHQAHSQELGLNFNHNMEHIDFGYVEKTGVSWLRTTPRILDYTAGILEIENDPALDSLIEANRRGYEIAFGYRWDFKKRNMPLPAPDSPEESTVFSSARQMLSRVAPHIRILKLGNEPAFETLPEDLIPNSEGEIPLLSFTDRLLRKVVIPFYNSNTELALPQIYVGSIVWPYHPKQQNSPATRALIKYTEDTPEITGLSIHLHIRKIEDIEASFRFIRSRMPTKPIIVPEFSLQPLYRSKLTEKLGETIEGQQFAKAFGRDPDWKLHQWYSYANTHRVSTEEWLGMLESRDWYPKHYLKSFYESYRRHGVVLATYPLVQQSCPKNVTPKTPIWFLNPLFCQKSLFLNSNGSYARNPLCYEDFIKLKDKGHNDSNSKD